MSRMFALVALVVIGSANARIVEKLGDRSPELQGAFLATNDREGQQGPWLCPGGKDRSCARKCDIYLNAFSSYCFTFTQETPDLTLGDDLLKACGLIQSWLLTQPAYSVDDFCDAICNIDLARDLNILNHFLEPVTEFWINFDGVQRDALRVEQVSAFGSLLCCSNIVDGCLAPPVCTHPSHGGWTLLASPTNKTESPELAHGVRCGDRDQDIDFDNPIELFIPLDKKVLCYADCTVKVITPVCDTLVEVSDW